MIRVEIGKLEWGEKRKKIDLYVFFDAKPKNIQKKLSPKNSFFFWTEKIYLLSVLK